MVRTSFLAVCFAATLCAQDVPPPEIPAAAAAQALAALPNAPRPNSPDPQPYEKVITKDAKTSKGIFIVHQIKDRYYYEIPKAELERQFLLNIRISRTTVGVGYGGEELASRVVRWELNGNKINLRDVNYSVTADPKTPISLAVKAANNDTILMTFPVAAFAKDGAPVVEVARLFTSDVPEFSVRTRLGATTADVTRSYVERIAPYPENIEAESTLTYTRIASPVGVATPQILVTGGMRPGSATVVVHYSMVKLPEKPMMPRMFDERVGYFTTSLVDYSKE